MNRSVFIDKIAPKTTERWIVFFFFILLFMWIVLKKQSHYVICYALWIYLLNGFILFLSPLYDPDEDGSSSLPKTNEDEFKPFLRKLPEMDFWIGSTTATVLSVFTTFFSIFDLPVFWPILVFYFIALTILMLRKQIEHMIRHKYVPFNIGKKKYKEGNIRL